MPRKKKKKAPPKPMGRPRRSMDFAAARDIILKEHISSRSEYEKWWLFNNPVGIPKRPDRSYQKEWQGWNHFLGNNNIFTPLKKVVRPFQEARAYVRTLRLSTITDWYAYVKTGQLPADIPKRPDFCYRESKKATRGGVWFSWKDWLGSNSMADQMDAIRSQLNVLLITKPDHTPSNVFQLIMVKGFDNDIKAKIKKDNLFVLKAYELTDFDWLKHMKKHYQNYYGVEDHFLIGNVNEVFYIFDMNMKKYA